MRREHINLCGTYNCQSMAWLCDLLIQAVVTCAWPPSGFVAQYVAKWSVLIAEKMQ